ncbi:sensor histidine kinase [Plesiocystis pacifica SIR-1]|uniref:histidine kinase n=1 Tax=Plesiocystis pacifica SIR-1 TaxID=391625 RepID=A6G0F6_9BACT|nr:ATP-binding protein [Plesiocystis pacifica]EDM80602.1 sensor histidine kinase [Plesiocystis pacifica SIR-1]
MARSKAKAGTNPPRSSLRVELIAVLAIILVMAAVSLSFAAELLGGRRHDQQEVERLQSHARQLAVLTGRNFRGGDFERGEVEELLGNSAGLLGVSYVLHRERGDGEFERIVGVGVHTDFDALPPLDPSLSAPQVDDSLLGKWNLLVLDEPVPTLGGERVVLRMVAEHSPWTRTLDWRNTLIVAGGVGCLLLVLGGLLLEVQVLRPMRSLERAVAEVAGGSLEVEAPTDGPAELRELAERFNVMTASLRTKERALAEQSRELQRSERMAAVGRLAAGVAHEVGNPLAAVVGYTELLLGEPELSEEARDLLTRVGAQTQRIQGIVAQLLDYSKPAAVESQRFSPWTQAREVFALLRADPRCAGVRLALDEGDAELAVFADPSLVEQILINLVLNGAHAVREHADAPEVRIEVRKAETEHDGEARRWVDIEVVDNGPGVPPEVVERLFEPFFTTRSAGQGTGLGLAISQGLAERMGGSLSHVEGAPRPASLPGARFRLRLPAEAAT